MQLIRKISLLTLISTSFFAKIASSQQSTNPIIDFLQRNADTTIAISRSTNWGIQYKTFYLSKKGDTINLYRYGENFNHKIRLPKKIRDSVYLASKDWEIGKLGINRFFTVININDNEVKTLWQKVTSQKPWQIKDDKHDGGEGCPEYYTKEKYISDLGGISLYLVTKNEIKTLYFYAPKYLETEVCPSRLGRKAILKIEELFDKYFKE